MIHKLMYCQDIDIVLYHCSIVKCVTTGTALTLGATYRSTFMVVFSFCSKSSCALCTHFFLPPDFSPSSLRSQVTTFPSITTPLPSMKATRERPSQFLKVSATSGC